MTEKKSFTSLLRGGKLKGSRGQKETNFGEKKRKLKEQKKFFCISAGSEDATSRLNQSSEQLFLEY
jgi:hypothetical protein